VEPKQDSLILKISGTSVEGVVDKVATELPIRLILNGKPLVTLLCTPTELEELAVGFLLSEGILRRRSSIKQMVVDEKEAVVRIELSELPADWETMFEKKTISSGCGRGITFTNNRTDLDRKIDAPGHLLTLDDVRKLLILFRTISTLYLETGGVHSAALSDGREILFFSEDIGRHNAVDKLIGKAFLKGISVENKVLLTSGSITSSIDRLERDHLVERAMATSDRRSRIVHLTEAGEHLIRSRLAAHERDLDRAFEALSEAEMETLVAILAKVGRGAAGPSNEWAPVAGEKRPRPSSRAPALIA